MPSNSGLHISGFRSFDTLEREICNILAHSTAVAALNAAHARGRNRRHFADQLAVDAMRQVLHAELPIGAEVVTGEGGRDETPMLFIGEKLGPDTGSTQMSIAVDPLEGTNLCARGEPGAITVIAAALSERGQLLGGIVMFALTGVTYNQYTSGVQYQSGGTAITHTIYGRSRSGTVYERRAIHHNPPAQPEFPTPTP